MLAVYAKSFDEEDPLAGLVVGERPDPVAPDGWVTIDVKAASLNRHDLSTLRGRLKIAPENMPMILGSDCAGRDEDGNEVVIHALFGDADKGNGDETLDPGRHLLSEVNQGTFAEKLIVPARNVLRKPAHLTFEEASCLPTAWLTAYRMLTQMGEVKPGQTILVQGAGGGVATALIALGRAMGIRVWATSRSEEKRALAIELGAHQAFETGAALPERVDVVMETVGIPTWKHSVSSLKRGGSIVIAGATGGAEVDLNLRSLFLNQQRVIGTLVGTRIQFVSMLAFMEANDIRPRVDQAIAMSEARSAFVALEAGDVNGKMVLVNQ